jgi:DNA repair protein RecN (Recombination protein N)
MLTELRIRNFAIIESLELSLDSGFIVFSGETGAGKSIIIDAVELLLGGRGETTVIRSGEDTALLEASFRLEPRVQEPVHEILDAEGLLDDPHYVTMGREIRLEGRNICRINGRTVNLSMLREIGEFLVDVHGQSEHLSLLRIREHLNLLDRYGNVEELRREFSARFDRLRQLRGESAALRKAQQDADDRADMLRYQINEIEAAALEGGELEDLLEERTRLANAEQLATLTEQALAAIDDPTPSHPSASDMFGEAVAAIEDLAGIDESMASLHREAQALLESMTNIAGQLRTYRDQIEFNPRRLDTVEERVSLIRRLERKYGGGIPQVLEHADRARQQLNSIADAEDQLQDMSAEEAKLLDELGEIGGRLSEAREQASHDLSDAVEGELSDLSMPDASFDTFLAHREDAEGIPVNGQHLAFTRAGIDLVEFLVEPNPGEGLKPLVKIASGGETSRLMLGLKTVLAKADRTPTLIFDEIDQGIGGRVGAVVGQKLWALARDHQVLCVTHLPQLAAYADQHYRVEKIIDQGRTLTIVRSLSDQALREELALMLGGVSQANLESASELLADASQTKSTTSR